MLEVRPNADFSYEAAKGKLVNLRLGEDDGPQVTFVVPGDVVAGDDYDHGENVPGNQGRLLRLSGWVDMESRVTVSTVHSHLYTTHLSLLGRMCCCSIVILAATESSYVSAWR